MPGPGRPPQAAGHVPGRSPATLLPRPAQVPRQPLVADPRPPVAELGHRTTAHGAQPRLHETGPGPLAQRERTEETAVEVDEPVRPGDVDEELQLDQPDPSQAAQELLAPCGQLGVDRHGHGPRRGSGGGREETRRDLLDPPEQLSGVHDPDDGGQVTLDRLLQDGLVLRAAEGPQVLDQLRPGRADGRLDPVRAALLGRPVPAVLDHDGQGDVRALPRRGRRGHRGVETGLHREVGEHELVHRRGDDAGRWMGDRHPEPVAMVRQRRHPVVAGPDDDGIPSLADRAAHSLDEGVLVTGGPRDHHGPLDGARGTDQPCTGPGRRHADPPTGAPEGAGGGHRSPVTGVREDEHRRGGAPGGGHGGHGMPRPRRCGGESPPRREGGYPPPRSGSLHRCPGRPRTARWRT